MGPWLCWQDGQCPFSVMAQAAQGLIKVPLTAFESASGLRALHAPGGRPQNPASPIQILKFPVFAVLKQGVLMLSAGAKVVEESLSWATVGVAPVISAMAVKAAQGANQRRCFKTTAEGMNLHLGTGSCCVDQNRRI